MNVKHYAKTKQDVSRVNKLNKLTNIKTFWDDVRKLTKNITSSKGIRVWQILAENRYNELLTGHEDIYIKIEYGKPTRYFKRLDDTEVYPI